MVELTQAGMTPRMLLERGQAPVALLMRHFLLRVCGAPVLLRCYSGVAPVLFRCHHPSVPPIPPMQVPQRLLDRIKRIEEERAHRIWEDKVRSIVSVVSVARSLLILELVVMTV